MLKKLVLAMAATAVMGVAGASAQTVDFGREGPSIDLRSRGDRERDIRRSREREFDREADRGGRNCRTITVREQDDDGRTVTRRRRECN